jgi:hypothetical protein
MADIGKTAVEGLNIAQRFFVVGVVAIILLAIAIMINQSMTNSTALYDIIIGPFLKYWPLTALFIALGIGLYVLVPIVKKLMTELATA